MTDRTHRAALTDRYTTAADAAPRPGETVSEARPERVAAPDTTELRRLLDEATPGPWHAWNRGIGFEVHTEVEHNPIRCDPLNSEFRETFRGPDAHLIAAAVNALPSLLDELDRLARLLDEPRRSGCAVEVAGVRIAPCDERGRTSDMCAADHLRRELAHMTEARDNARQRVAELEAAVERVRVLHFGRCFDCGADYPCPTIAALGEATVVSVVIEGGRV